MNDSTHPFDPALVNQVPTEARAPSITDRETEENRQIIMAYFRENEAEMREFYANLDKQEWVPAEQLRRELEEIVRQKKQERLKEPS